MELMFVRNGAKIYVKNPRVLHREKIRETGLYEILSLTPAQKVVAYSCVFLSSEIMRGCTSEIL
jgi:hypothetical protein